MAPLAVSRGGFSELERGLEQVTALLTP